ncbi:hypothetical protein SAMN05661096_02456 [Marivirga sericea]|uniref:PEP-CTERM protein-sorting domain-containing protein n=1 Tax=Marivirga sericea TaxID=1028 RepID=A0A1X7K9T4_9BACT|nr:hypothetical protein [Marivirga sericea]SMG37494.1 hypothetical protein SAMN05661096_02456 [Marivirga sericea]
MNNILKLLTLTVFLIIGGFSLNAQPGPPGPPEDNPVPITGIEYLIAAGAAFGAKKIYDKKKK